MQTNDSLVRPDKLSDSNAVSRSKVSQRIPLFLQMLSFRFATIPSRSSST